MIPLSVLMIERAYDGAIMLVGRSPAWRLAPPDLIANSSDAGITYFEFATVSPPPNETLAGWCAEGRIMVSAPFHRVGPPSDRARTLSRVGQWFVTLPDATAPASVHVLGAVYGVNT